MAATSLANMIKYDESPNLTVIVKKLGGSVAIVIPKAVANNMELTVGTSLEISSGNDQVVMRSPGREIDNRRPAIVLSPPRSRSGSILRRHHDHMVFYLQSYHETIVTS
jgi:antitoxin component of MazEF toxin-antitoxin module